MTFPLRSFAWTGAAIATVAVVVANSCPAGADPPGCLPLNGAQLTANSHENTNYFGITYDTTVTYWYQDGAVNWHKTVDGGELNIVHTDTTGTVPAAPGSTVTIPGATANRPRSSDGTPTIVNVCNR